MWSQMTIGFFRLDGAAAFSHRVTFIPGIPYTRLGQPFGHESGGPAAGQAHAAAPEHDPGARSDRPIAQRRKFGEAYVLVPPSGGTSTATSPRGRPAGRPSALRARRTSAPGPG